MRFTRSEIERYMTSRGLFSVTQKGKTFELSSLIERERGRGEDRERLIVWLNFNYARRERERERERERLTE